MKQVKNKEAKAETGPYIGERGGSFPKHEKMEGSTAKTSLIT